MSRHVVLSDTFQFKADRLPMIVVAKNLSVLQLFISRMPKMCAILQFTLNAVSVIKEDFSYSSDKSDCLFSL